MKYTGTMLASLALPVLLWLNTGCDEDNDADEPSEIESSNETAHAHDAKSTGHHKTDDNRNPVATDSFVKFVGFWGGSSSFVDNSTNYLASIIKLELFQPDPTIRVVNLIVDITAIPATNLFRQIVALTTITWDEASHSISVTKIENDPEFQITLQDDLTGRIEFPTEYNGLTISLTKLNP